MKTSAAEGKRHKISSYHEVLSQYFAESKLSVYSISLLSPGDKNELISDLDQHFVSNELSSQFLEGFLPTLSAYAPGSGNSVSTSVQGCRH